MVALPFSTQLTLKCHNRHFSVRMDTLVIKVTPVVRKGPVRAHWPSSSHLPRLPLIVSTHCWLARKSVPRARQTNGCSMAGIPRPPASVHAGLGNGGVPETGSSESPTGLGRPPCEPAHTADRSRRDPHRPTRPNAHSHPPLIELAEISIDQREPYQAAGSTDPSGPSGGIRFTRSAIRPSMSATRFLRPQFCSCFSRP